MYVYWPLTIVANCGAEATVGDIPQQVEYLGHLCHKASVELAVHYHAIVLATNNQELTFQWNKHIPLASGA